MYGFKGVRVVGSDGVGARRKTGRSRPHQKVIRNLGCSIEVIVQRGPGAIRGTRSAPRTENKGTGWFGMQRSARSTTTHAVFPGRSAALTPLQLRAISSSPNENRTRPRAGLRAASSGEPGLRPPSEALQLSAHVVDSIEEISRTEWNACARGTEELNPFVQWDFLHCLEASKSVVSLCMTMNILGQRLEIELLFGTGDQ